MSVTVTVAPGAVQALTRRGGPLDNDMQMRASKGLQAARMRAPVDTGRLRASGLVEPSQHAEAGWDIVFPVNYAIYVDQGTRFMFGRPFLTSVLPLLV